MTPAAGQATSQQDPGDGDARWAVELDHLDVALDAAEAALAAGDPAESVAAALPTGTPAGLPPLPAELRDRAELVLGRIALLSETLTEQLRTLGTTIARSQRPGGAAPVRPATPRFIDQSM